MKVFIGITAFALILQVFDSVDAKMTIDQIRHSLQPIKTSCLKKVTVDIDLVEGTKLGNYPEDRPLMCFIKCVMQMMRVASKNGDILVGSMNQQVDLIFPEEHVDEMKQIIINCNNEASTKEGTCEVPYAFARCFYRSNSDLFFFP